MQIFWLIQGSDFLLQKFLKDCFINFLFLADSGLDLRLSPQLKLFAEVNSNQDNFLGLRPLAGYASLKLYHVMLCFLYEKRILCYHMAG